MDQIDDQTLNINKMTLDFKGSAYDWLNVRTNLKLTSQENSLYQPGHLWSSAGFKRNSNIKARRLQS